MQIQEETFGNLDGRKVTRYILTNSRQTQIAVLSLGGTLQEFTVIEEGYKRKLTIGLKSLADYQNNVFNISQSVGRVAGRIGDAKFTLDGQTYHVDMNEQHHSLHGGYHGFTKINFEGKTEQSDDDASVTLTHEVKSSVDHYPGNIMLKIKFTLNEKDQVGIEYSARTDSPTLFNPTNHVYWNVTDDRNSLDQQWLQIHSSKRVESGEEKVPTGNLLDVNAGVYDFNRPRNLQKALRELTKETKKVEFDDAYEVIPDLTHPVASIGDIKGKRRVDIYSDRNGLVIFTADPINTENQDAHRYNSLATEAQTLPDAINHPGFGDITLWPNHDVTRHIRFDYHYLS